MKDALFFLNARADTGVLELTIKLKLYYSGPLRAHPQVAAIKTALSLKGHAAGIPRRPIKPLPEDETKTVYEDLHAMDLLQEILSPFIQLFKFG